MELTIIYLNTAIEIYYIVWSKCHDSFLESVGATLKKTGLGIAALRFTRIVHRINIDDLDIIELLDSLFYLNLVGALVNDKTVAGLS